MLPIEENPNAWESPIIPASEKEKKELARTRIDSEFEGKNLRPYKKARKVKFKAPTKEEQEYLDKLDQNGNPRPGYKWGSFNKKTKKFNIVEDKNFKIVEKDGFFNIIKTLN